MSKVLMIMAAKADSYWNLLGAEGLRAPCYAIVPQVFGSQTWCTWQPMRLAMHWD